jgi:hypothetical protein
LVCGLLVSAIIGGFVGSTFDTANTYSTGTALILGAVAGLLVFTCGRLWMTSGKT